MLFLSIMCGIINLLINFFTSIGFEIKNDDKGNNTVSPDCTTHFKDGGGTSTLIDCQIQNTLHKNQVEERQKNRWTV
jgi:hypothetical protein